MDRENGGMKLNDDFLVILVYLEQTILVIDRTTALFMVNLNVNLNVTSHLPFKLLKLKIKSLKRC